MAINISELFSDILPDPRKELQNKALTRAALASQGMQGPLAALSATTGYNSALSGEGMRAGLNRMTGGAMSTAAERLQKASEGIDTSTPQGQAQLLSIVRRERGAGAAEQLREVFLERNRQAEAAKLAERQTQVQEGNLAVSQRTASAYERQVEGQERQQALSAQRQQEQLEMQRNQLNLLNGNFTVDGEGAILAIRNGVLVREGEDGQFVPVTGKVKAANGVDYTTREMIMMQEAATQSTDSLAKGIRAGELRRTLERMQPSTADLYTEGFSRRLGFGDVDLSAVISEYETLRISASKENQSAGPQSDKDIQLALAPIPEGVNWRVMASWLSGVEKLAILESERARRELIGLEQKLPRSAVIDDWQQFISDPENVQMLLESKGARFVDENALIDQAMARINGTESDTQPMSRPAASPRNMNTAPFRGF